MNFLSFGPGVWYGPAHTILLHNRFSVTGFVYAMDTAPKDPSQRRERLKYQRVSHVAWRRIDGIVIVVDMRRKRVVALNAMGGKIWTILEQPVEWSDLWRRFRQEVRTDIAPHILQRWLADFLQELQARELVTADGHEPEHRAPGASSESPTDPVWQPRVEWVESLQKFGQSCAFLPGQGGVCEANPATS